jgi:hypothetical protein
MQEGQARQEAQKALTFENGWSMPLARASRVGGGPQESSLLRQLGRESRRTSSSVLANRPVALGVVSLAAWDTPASHGVPHAVAFTSIHPNGGARSRLPLVGDSITQRLSHDIGHVLGLQHTHKQDQCRIWMRRTRQCSPGCSASWTILVLNDGSVRGKKSTLCTPECWHGAERACHGTSLFCRTNFCTRAPVPSAT